MNIHVSQMGVAFIYELVNKRHPHLGDVDVHLSLN